MRSADKRERAVAVHEAGHAAMAYWLKLHFKEVRIKRRGNEITGEGTIWWPPFPENWQSDNEATLELKTLMFKRLMVYSAGLIAEWLHSGERVFTRDNPDLMECHDMAVLRELASIFPKDEFKKVLGLAVETIAEPGAWGIIVDMATDLLRDRVIKGTSRRLGGLSASIDPEHDPSHFIDRIYDAMC